MQTQQLTKLGKGSRKRVEVMRNRNNSSGASLLTMKLDSQLISRRDFPKLGVHREKDVSEVVFHALLSNAHEELAELLRDVRTGYERGPGVETRDNRSSELLMRAVRCAAKQYMLQAELGNLALTDELTGLFNSRAFQALAERQLKLGHRSGRGMLLFFMDLDGLKDINDSLGHAKGDHALKRTAETLKKTFRDSDVIARLGGDEFAVLAVEAAGHSEAAVLRRLQKCLNTINAENSQFAISLSVGVARFDCAKHASIRDLMAAADEAMYAQKRARPRSRVAAGGNYSC